MTLRGLAPVGGGRRRRGVLGRFESPIFRATAGVREVSPPREKLPFREPLKTRGEIERIAELELLLAEPMPQQERMPFEQELTVLRGLPVLQEEFGQVQLDIREIDLTQAFRNFYQDIEMSEATVQTLLVTAEESPESFLRDIEQVGRTPESEDLLRILGATPEDIELILGEAPEAPVIEPPPEPIDSVVVEIDNVRQLVIRTDDNSLYDRFGNWVGFYNYLDDTVYNPYKAEGLGAKALASLTAGIGDVLSTAGGAARWLGYDEVGSKLSTSGKQLQQYGVPTTSADFAVSDLLDPEFYATKIVRTIPFALSLAPLSIGGYMAGGGLAATVGLGTIWQAIAGGLVGGLLSRPVESAMEAGGQYDDAIARGKTEKEASEEADEVFRNNMVLAGADAWQIAIALAPTPKWVPTSLVRSGLVRTVRIGGKMVIIGLSEGGEEVYQDMISRRARGEEWQLDPVAKEVFAIGAVMGLGMGLGGDIISGVVNSRKNELTSSETKLFNELVTDFKVDGLTQEQAELRATDEVSSPNQLRRLFEQAKEIIRREEGAVPIGREPEEVRPEIIKGTEPGGIETLSIKDEKGEVISSLAYTQTRDSIILNSMGTVETVQQQGLQTNLWNELSNIGKPIETRAGTLTDAGEGFIQNLENKGFNVVRTTTPKGIAEYTLTKPPVTPEVAPEAVRPPTVPVEPEIPTEIPVVPVVEGVARKGTDVREAIPPEMINEPTPITVDDTLTVHDLNVIDRVRPTRFVFDKMGLFDIWQSAFEAETLKAEEQVAFNKELNKHAKAVGKDTVRRELMWEFVNNSNQEVFNQLTFEEKRAALWWKRTADNWADRLGIPKDQRIKDYIPHIFDEQAKQDKDLIVDASISMMFSKKITDRVKMPFLEERLGKVNGLIKDPFLAAQAYQNVALKKFYYEPILQKLKLVSEHKDAQGNFTTPEFARNYLKDYSKRMTGEPSSIDREINRTLTDMANKVRGLPGGEALANFLDRGNPSGMAAYNLTSALYVMWLGFKPTTAIRNLSQHGLIIADVDSIQDFGNGIRLRFTKEGRAALEESLVWRSRRGAFIESIDSSMASQWSDSVRETALFMFRKADEQNVKDAFLSGYAEAKRLYPDADRSWWIKRGDEVAADTQYLYTKMNSLAISQNGPGKVLSMLTTWAINWLELMNKFVRGKQSRVYIDLVKQSDGKFALKEKNWLTSRKSLLAYIAIVGLAYAIKEQDWNRVKTFEYTGWNSINTISNLIGGDFPALQLPGAVADLVTGTLLKDERKTKTAVNELKHAFSILNQVERVASGERDWLSLLFYLEGKNYQVRQLKEDWEDNWESYDDLTDPLIRAKKYPTLNENTARKRWREQNSKIEAQMFVTNRLGTLSSEEARQEVLRLIKKHNIDTDVINGYEKIFGVDTTIELNKFQKRIGNLEKLKIDEEAKYFTTANFLTELNGAVKINGRDKVERDGHAFSVFALGQQDSWQPYEDYDPKTGARLLYRQNNPDVEASLYMFGKVSAFENPKSAEILLGWMDKYNIPPQAIKAFNENPDRYDELFTQKFELEKKNFDLTTQYENYSNSEASNYIEDKEERKLAREKFKEDNPEWIADQRRIEAIDNDASSELIEKWAERGKVLDEFGASSSESKVWLIDNPDTNQWALDNKLLTDDLSDENIESLRLKVKLRGKEDTPKAQDDMRRIRMLDLGAESDVVNGYVAYGKITDEFSPSSAEAKLFRIDNPSLNQFGIDNDIWIDDLKDENINALRITVQMRDLDETSSEFQTLKYKRQAYEFEFPENQIQTYIDWYTKPEKPDNWKDESGTDLWYEDDWFLIANQEFYQTMRDKGIFTERRDYRKVPTRKVFTKYQEYLALPTFADFRKDYRWENQDLDEWLVLKWDYVSIVEQRKGEEEAELEKELTPSEKFKLEVWKRERAIAPTLRDIKKKLEELME